MPHPSLLVAGSCTAEGITDDRNGFLCLESAHSIAVRLQQIMHHKDYLHRVGQGSPGGDLYQLGRRCAPRLRSLPYCDRQLQVKAIKDNKKHRRWAFRSAAGFFAAIVRGYCCISKKGENPTAASIYARGRKRSFQFNPVARGGVLCLLGKVKVSTPSL